MAEMTPNQLAREIADLAWQLSPEHQITMTEFIGMTSKKINDFSLGKIGKIVIGNPNVKVTFVNNQTFYECEIYIVGSVLVQNCQFEKVVFHKMDEIVSHFTSCIFDACDLSELHNIRQPETSAENLEVAQSERPHGDEPSPLQPMSM